MRTAVVAHYMDSGFISDLDKTLFTVYYNSKKFNYVYIYFNKKNEERAINLLRDIDSILEIEQSLFDVEQIVI